MRLERFVFLYGEDEDVPSELMKYKKLLSERNRKLGKMIYERIAAVANVEKAIARYNAKKSFIKLKVMQKFGIGALMFGGGQ